VLALALVAAAVLPVVHTAAAHADEVTVSQNNLRTGWDPDEPGLAPVSDGGPVGSATFGQLFETRLNGEIYAQPIVVGDTVIVATETNHVYGVNAATGAVEWSNYLGPAQTSAELHCNDLTPDVGVTSTPVYDPTTGTVYLVAAVHSGSVTAQPAIDVFALDAQTGTVRPGWPVPIQGSPYNDPGVKFDPLTERQRAGLLLLGGSIYVGFASYCDYLPYAGYVAGVSTTSRKVLLWSDEVGVTDNQGGIWQSGGGLMSDGSGRIFVATGNGVSPPAGSGASAPQALGDSVVRLNVGANGELTPADFFSPANAPTLDANDEDFGAGGPVGLPFGTAALPDLLVQAGKDGRVFLLDRDDLGGREQGPGGTDDDVSESGPYGGQWGHPAVFGPGPTVSASTSDDYVYYVGENDQMRYLQFGQNGSTPELTDVANSSTTFGYSSGSPVVTSNGDDPASAVIWEVYASGVTGADGTLEAFPAVPSSSCTSAAQCTISPIWSAPIGTVTNFPVAATDSGHVYVGNRDGDLYGFGSPDAAPLSSAPVNFSQVRVGKAAAATATLTAASQVTISSISAAAPFKAGAAKVNGAAASFPVTLNPGDELTVPVTFTPKAAGGVIGALQAVTNFANFPSVSVSLTGRGTEPGLYSPTRTLSFGRYVDGTTVTRSVMIADDSAGAERVAATARPGSPFSAGLPAIGKTLTPGESVRVPVTFRPGHVATYSSAFTITASGGRKLTIRLTGTGKTAVSGLKAKASSLSFGRVAAGSRKAATIVFTNTGDLPATVTAVSGLAGPFGGQVYVPAGLPLNPGYTLSLPVTFTPTSGGLVTGKVVLRWRDALGSHQVAVRVSGTGTAAARSLRAVPPPGGGWTLAGSASMSGEKLELTHGRDEAGSAVYAVPESGNGLRATFSAQLSGDGGMTMSLLDASTAGVSALGGSGGEFGAGGQRGVSVALGTAEFTGDPAPNFAGIATSGPAGLSYARTTTRIPRLAAGTTAIGVTVSSGRVRVSVAGKQVLSVALSSAGLAGRFLIAFTGATGGSAGSQIVTDASVRTAAGALPPPGGGWSFNAAASMVAGAAALTPARKNDAGTVIYPSAVPTDGLTATFTAQLSGGSGGNGLAFALLNPADATAASAGRPGAMLGLGKLTGVAVALDTIQTDSDGFTSSAYICQTTATSTSVTVDQMAQAIPPLRAGVNTVTVQVGEDQGYPLMTVWLDGEMVVQTVVPALTPSAILAFTASTGKKTDVHLVRDVAITTAG
jgi:putative pyrroloquinoline-quinone binding quinoprotein/ASPM-SPD-2-Hydin domain-containing protein/putative pyrroloquinoline-quinone-binding quinoprotein